MALMLGNFENMYNDKNTKILEIHGNDGRISGMVFKRAIDIKFREDHPSYILIPRGSGKSLSRKIQNIMATYNIELSMYQDDLLSIRDDMNILKNSINYFFDGERVSLNFDIKLGPTDSVRFSTIQASDESAKLLLEIL